MSSWRTLVIRTRGVITSAAEWSENRSVRLEQRRVVLVEQPRQGGAADQGAELLGRSGPGQLLLRLDAHATG